MNTPMVSVVVINQNGRHYLEACFRSLQKQHYPVDLVELMLVDNHSSDDSIAFMQQYFPTVKVVTQPRHISFSKAVNLAVKMAQGVYVAIIGYDSYADQYWLKKLVEGFNASTDLPVVCVGSVVYDWYGRNINFIQPTLNFHGHMEQLYQGVSKESVASQPIKSLSANRLAMMVDRQIFLKLGGFDPDLVDVYEDIDFGWRGWLSGYSTLIEPQSIIYNRNTQSKDLHSDQLKAVYQRNALATIIKNYSEDSLLKVLPTTLFLIIQKSLGEIENYIPWQQYDLRFRGEHTLNVEVPRTVFSYLSGVKDILDNFEEWWRKREVVQELRQCSDSDILPLFEHPIGSAVARQEYIYLQQVLTDLFDIKSLFNQTKQVRVLVISSDPLGAKISGVGMRSLEMARCLSQHVHVTLASPDKADIQLPDVVSIAFTHADTERIHSLVTNSDVLIASSHILNMYPAFLDIRRVRVIDLYDPVHFENIDYHTRTHATLEEAQGFLAGDINLMEKYMHLADFFICASERQRDMWLGWLSSSGRVNVSQYLNDPSFYDLITVVPFGMQDDPPVATHNVLKGVYPGINEEDTLLLWNGGIWDWFDPLTLIHAMAQIRTQRPDVKLFFMGARHPNPMVPNMTTYDKALDLAQQLGLRDQTVFFNDSWVPYDERQNYLLEADWAVSTHIQHIETRFSFRTRLLDCFWASLPMIVNSGDVLSEYIDEYGLGYVVPSGDVQLLAETILQAVAEVQPKQARLAAFSEIQAMFAWSNTLKPLIEFCKNPKIASDYQHMQTPDTAPLQFQSVYSAGKLSDLQKRSDWLDEVVNAKDEHIRYLEHVINSIESGRVMQGLRLIDTLRSKL